MIGRCLVTLAVIALAAGCGARPSAPPAGEPGAATSDTASASSVIDDLTGRTAVRAGQRAKETIKAVSAGHERDLEGALKE